MRTHARQARRSSVLLIVAWVPFLVRAVQFYVARQLPAGARSSRPTAATFREFLEQQDFFVFVITIYVGAGLIANDRRANALQIYLSKPLMRARVHRRQAAGRCSRSCCSSRCVPAILLLLLQVLFAGSFAFLRTNLFLFPAITVCSRSPGAAGVVHDAGAVVAVEEQPVRRHPVRRHHLLHEGASTGVLYAITGSSARLVDLARRQLAQVVDVIFRLQPRYDTPWPVSLLVVIGLIALSIVVLERRVRGVEVVT